VTNQINDILANFFSTLWRLWLALTLRTKKNFFEQLLHTASQLCGKGVDSVLRLGGSVVYFREEVAGAGLPAVSEGFKIHEGRVGRLDSCYFEGVLAADYVQVLVECSWWQAGWV
jgi:hypothetical protein